MSLACYDESIKNDMYDNSNLQFSYSSNLGDVLSLTSAIQHIKIPTVALHEKGK
jgi:hypothetical protein